MQVADFAVDTLAAARLARLVHADRIGRPARVALLRRAYPTKPARLGVHPSLDVEQWAAIDPRPPLLAELVACRWCLSVWTAAGVIAARQLAPRLWDPLARVLAASELAGLTAAIDNR